MRVRQQKGRQDAARGSDARCGVDGGFGHSALGSDFSDKGHADDEAERTHQIKGKVTAVAKGQTTGHVHIDIGNGTTIHCSITNEAIDDLVLTVGDDAIAVIKASDVMVAK